MPNWTDVLKQRLKLRGKPQPRLQPASLQAPKLQGSLQGRPSLQSLLKPQRKKAGQGVLRQPKPRRGTYREL